MDEESKKIEKIIEKFSQIHGVGPVIAKKLVDDGARTMRDLRSAKYFNTLPEETKYYLKYDIADELSWDYVNSILAILPKYLVGVGSYRRERAICRDVDVLTIKGLSDVLDDIKATSDAAEKTSSTFRFIGAYAEGESKCSAIIKFKTKYVKIDIFKTTVEERPFALLHFTGSKEFNIRTRFHAKQNGFKLSQHGLIEIATGKPVEGLKTEAQILKKIGVTYKVPSAR
jgi:DNA polymerase/3'-5' exonuclease PolX